MNPEDFKEGENVRVTAGPFKTCSGTVVGHADDKVLVKLVIFGRVLSVPIAAEILRRSGSD
jgi:transcription antitermination factor NusG